jgi:hypothetical protein
MQVVVVFGWRGVYRLGGQVSEGVRGTGQTMKDIRAATGATPTTGMNRTGRGRRGAWGRSLSWTRCSTLGHWACA